MIKFGPSGSSKSFSENSKNTTLDIPKWLKNMDLDCFEYSFGRGVRMSNATAEKIGSAFSKENIEISVHAPYYISFASLDEQKLLNSTNYIMQSLEKLKLMGGNRCVFHPGSESGQQRCEAMKKILGAVDYTLQKMQEYGFENMIICPETMGKLAQMGTVEEIADICKLAPNIYPCIDFGHINAREQGILKTRDDYRKIVDFFANSIGDEKTKNMHIHFSKIKYGPKGELCHLTFDDMQYGPEFEPLAEILLEYKMTPRIICESRGTQGEDALFMKNCYKSLI